MISEMDDFNDELIEELPMQRGLISQIEECRQPHHFREVIKRSKSAFNFIQYLSMVVVRIDFVIENNLVFDCLEMLQEIREELLDFIEKNKHQNGNNPSEKSKNNLRILMAKKVSETEKNYKERLLSENANFIEKSLTLQVWEETKRDNQETARRLGISKGALIQRLINAGACP